MSTNPLPPAKVPIPAIVTVRPVPELSFTVHASRTIWFPPMVTELGVAVKLATLGAGHAVTVTVTT
jgi:hypothetical protein